MIEAMVAGLAVIVATLVMIPDYVRDGEHALLVPPREVKFLEEALQRMIIDQALLQQLAINGHQLVKKVFAVEPVLKKLGDIVEATISG